MTEYGKVVLTLSTVFLPPEKLYPNPTPSTLEGLPWDVEYDLRLIGCELIQTACLLLKLPQTAVATGQVLFHRYYYTSSFVRRPVEIFAMACTNLAAKIEENARRLRDIINVFHHIKQVRSGSLIQPLLIDQGYIDRKNEIIKAERRILKELGFCVYVKHPHKMITLYLKVLEKERDKHLVQTSWNYMNDSLRTDIFLRYSSETIACACIELAARNLQIPLPRNPKWYLIFGAESEEIHQIMIAILRLYKHQPKSLDELEKFVQTLRDKREDEKRKLRTDSPAIHQQQSLPNPAESTPTIIQSEPVPSVVIKPEEPITQTVTTTNGKTHSREGSQDSSTVNNQRHHRRKRSGTQSDRSSSRSSSRSPARHSQKKKKSSRRSRSRSRSHSRRKHRHHTSSTSHRKRDKKHRSRSSSREENYYSKSSKDANNNHQRHHSSKQINGISHRKVHLK